MHENSFRGTFVRFFLSGTQLFPLRYCHNVYITLHILLASYALQ